MLNKAKTTVDALTSTRILKNAQKISSRFQKISEGKVIDNEVFRANFLN